MTKQVKTATEIEREIRDIVGPTDCRLHVGRDLTGWHVTVGGNPDDVARINTAVMSAEAQLKPSYELIMHATELLSHIYGSTNPKRGTAVHIAESLDPANVANWSAWADDTDPAFVYRFGSAIAEVARQTQTVDWTGVITQHQGRPTVVRRG